MKKRNLILIALVFALIICATIQPAMAYFTTYVRAKGGHEVSLGDTTKIIETVSGWTKKVTIFNEDESEPVFIRAKVLYKGSFPIEVSGGAWTEKQEDGYYYYGSVEGDQINLTILEGGKSTGEGENALSVKINNVPPATIKDDNGKEIPNPAFQRLTEGEKSFSVVVVYESTPVRYTEAGTPFAAWEAQIVEVGSTTGGNG